MAGHSMKQKEINGNVEISVPLDDCGLDVRNPLANHNYLKPKGAFKGETIKLDTNITSDSEAVDSQESNVAGHVIFMEDAVSDEKHILTGADSVEDKQKNVLPEELPSAWMEEGSNDIWSDFASYCKPPLVPHQGVGTCGFPMIEENNSGEEHSLQQGSNVFNDNFRSHHPFPSQDHKSHTRVEFDNESKLSVSAANAYAQSVSTSKLNISRDANDNPGQGVGFADSTLKWAPFESNGWLVESTFQSDCRETTTSDFGGVLCPPTSSLLQIQEILSANSALKVDKRNLIENIFQNSFPSQPIKHAFEDIPALEKSLEMNGEGSDPIKAMESTSYEFANALEELQDLNKVCLKSSWKVSHSREKLLSTLGIDQNQKDNGQADLKDAMASYSDLEKTEVFAGVAALPHNGSKALIQTRISVMPPQRVSHGFGHQLETAFVQWMQMNGNRALKIPKIKRHSWFM
ncbi:uncharacterized protein LOC132385981 [Hypanus sabinus]|uniref:uncharacterized protein LOC132385981 n=1 Tax=Hypanus sabinus TaxID=79690 RepID=UPI0028C462AB|nr:uncharacterized protein LOC132385981 [Hypanus sabinus]XP_059814204.1 uncharacterized protein LOC132385981 [Hypanus sabinus]XP_059814210.1 uncharacterized protein LOC132385981 [Hypanus sabinus]